MTVSSLVRKVGPFAGDGVTTVFPFAFQVFVNADLRVVRTVSGIDSTLVLTSDYSVTLNANQSTSPGGNITLVAPLAVGATLTATSNLTPLQLTDLTNQGGFYPAVITAALDKLTILIQQLFAFSARAIAFPLSDTASANPLPNAAARANKYIVFDANGNPIVSSGTGTDAGLRSDLGAFSGSSLVNYNQGGTNAFTMAVQDRLRRNANFLDKLTASEITDSLLALPTIDLSAKAQAFIDENKGKVCIFPAGYSYLMAGVLLSGSTYNNTVVVMAGTHVLRATGTTPAIPIFFGLGIKDCDNVTLYYKGNGNRINQPNSEFIANVVIAGGSNHKVPYFDCREVRGDAMYIGQSTLNVVSTNPYNIALGIFWAQNSVDDGRNGLTVTGVNGLTCSDFRSVKIGSTIATVVEPGGLCFEPFAVGQTIANCIFDSVYIESAGGVCLQIAGDTESTSNDIAIGECVVINTSAPNTNSPITGLPTFNQYKVLNISLCNRVSISNFRGYFSNAYGDGINVDHADNINIKGSIEHVRTGISIGSINVVTDSQFDITVYASALVGYSTGAMTRCKMKGQVVSPVGGLSSNYFAVRSIGAGNSGAQIDCEYSVDVAFDAAWTRAYRNDVSFPVTFTNCIIHNCSLTGAWADMLSRAGDMQILRENVFGVTNGTSIPAAGFFAVGTRIYNVAATTSQDILGWYCLTAGNPGTWVPFYLGTGKKRLIVRNYAVTENFDCSQYDIFCLKVQSNAALTYNAPTGMSDGQEITITVSNISGGAMGAIAWNAVFKIAGWVNPANGFNRSATFYYDSTNTRWIPKNMTQNDMPN